MRLRWPRPADKPDEELFYEGTCRKCTGIRLISRHTDGLCEICYYEAIN